MSSIVESIGFWAVKFIAAFVRALPVKVALQLGKVAGTLAYYFDHRHRDIAYANLKIAFGHKKSIPELIAINKKTFQSFGQNFIELLRLPLVTQQNLDHFIDMEGEEHIQKALKDGKGLIYLVMHFGSWEMANVWSTLRGYPYRVLVKAQTRHSRLSDLLNSYRGGKGVVFERGSGTREFIKSLKENEIVALSADQGGKEGMQISFMGRQASMSVGAIRVALKLDVPLCFAVIYRVKDEKSKVILHPPFQLTKTGNLEEDLKSNLQQIVAVMEKYIWERPEEYMWFYKIWKYSSESSVLILDDGRTGHLRQSQTVAEILKTALGEREIKTQEWIRTVQYQSPWTETVLMLAAFFLPVLNRKIVLKLLKFCLTEDSFTQVISVKPDFIVSCGSNSAPLNRLLAFENVAKSISILKPGWLRARDFDLVIIPRHDARHHVPTKKLAITLGAPNLVTPTYLEEQSQGLLRRYSHLKLGDNFKVGVLVGGDTKDFVFSEQKVRVLIHQIIEAAEETKADVMITTSRRTSAKVENLIAREFKKYPRCKFLVLANRENVPEAVGGILALSEVVIVSGDSISMVSEAASSGKKVIVFPAETRSGQDFAKTKHGRFVDQLNVEGYILSSDVKDIKDSLYKLIKNKVQTKPLEDRTVLLESLRLVI